MNSTDTLRFPSLTSYLMMIPQKVQHAREMPMYTGLNFAEEKFHCLRTRFVSFFFQSKTPPIFFISLPTFDSLALDGEGFIAFYVSAQ